MPSSVVGGAALRKVALNCRPCVRSLTQVPLAWTNAPALIAAAAPTRVTSSRCPRRLTLSTQKPLSGLWKVTRSTSPASTSRSGGGDGTFSGCMGSSLDDRVQGRKLDASSGSFCTAPDSGAPSHSAEATCELPKDARASKVS